MDLSTTSQYASVLNDGVAGVSVTGCDHFSVLAPTDSDKKINK